MLKQENAPTYECALVMRKLSDLKYEPLEQPAYSPDFAPSDSHLFPNINKLYAGKCLR